MMLMHSSGQCFQASRMTCQPASFLLTARYSLIPFQAFPKAADFRETPCKPAILAESTHQWLLSGQLLSTHASTRPTPCARLAVRCILVASCHHQTLLNRLLDSATKCCRGLQLMATDISYFCGCDVVGQAGMLTVPRRIVSLGFSHPLAQSSSWASTRSLA